MTKRERTIDVLLREGLVGPGTPIVIHDGHLSGPWPEALGGLARRAHFGEDLRRRDNVVWEADQGSYSLTALRNLLIDRGAPFIYGATPYQHWSLTVRPAETLWDLAEEAGRRLA